ncbi:NUDIX domain-containing protein [Acidimicrobiia bacterium]|nr:NUDIX domain-containing protein [Acidimicrobiia bacterium]
MDDYKYQIKAITTDAAIFTIINGDLNCLLIKRGLQPFKNYWALPGGFLKRNESTDDAFLRELLEEAKFPSRGLNYWKELKSYSDPKRDPRNTDDYQIISIAYVGITNQEIIDNSNIKILGGSDAIEAAMIPVKDILGKFKKEIAFDHIEIIQDAIQFLSGKIEKESIALNFLPTKFTLSELRNVYEQLWGVTLHPSNFERKINSIENFITKTDETKLTGSNRPAKLYTKGSARKILLINNI